MLEPKVVFDWEELLNRYLRGDRTSCEQLLGCPKHRQRVESIARKYTRGTTVSWEDAAQTAHLKVFQAAKAGKFYRGEAREFYCWAARVARLEIIDFIRKQKHYHCTSLDQNIPGTNLQLSETISDKFNFSDAIERKDLVFRVIKTIVIIDRRYPQKDYLKLWQGKIEGKSQIQLGSKLGITQGQISKRWKELSRLIAEELGIL